MELYLIITHVIYRHRVKLEIMKHIIYVKQNNLSGITNGLVYKTDIST